MRIPIVFRIQSFQASKFCLLSTMAGLSFVIGSEAGLADSPQATAQQQHADDLNPDTHYRKFFRQLGIESAPAADSYSGKANSLNVDTAYRVFFRDLGVGDATAKPSDLPEKLISPPGIETVSEPGPPTDSTASTGPGDKTETHTEDGAIWSRIQHGFRLPELDSPLVASYEKWFARHPSYIKRVFDRGAIYLPYILQQIDRRDMPTEVALLPVIESAFNPFAVSHAKAVGMWQFISGTAGRYGVRMDFWYDGRRDVIDSTRAALDYLQFLESEMQGNWFHAFASYNGGENRLHREIRRNRKKGRSTNFVDLRLPRETRHYVPRLIALRNVVRDPARFGIELPQIDPAVGFRQLTIDYPIDLGIAAELSAMSLSDLRKLNPGYRRRSTGSSGASKLLLPTTHASNLLRALETRSAKSLLAAAGYRVRRGDTLSQIGKRNNLSVKAIKTANRLKGDFLKIGQVLTLPIHSQNFSALGKDGLAVFGESKKSSAKSKTKARSRITHRVRPGDTLSAIARRYRVFVKQIANWNSMRTTDVIRGGQRLVIYQPE